MISFQCTSVIRLEKMLKIGVHILFVKVALIFSLKSSKDKEKWNVGGETPLYGKGMLENSIYWVGVS